MTLKVFRGTNIFWTDRRTNERTTILEEPKNSILSSLLNKQKYESLHNRPQSFTKTLLTHSQPFFHLSRHTWLRIAMFPGLVSEEAYRCQVRVSVTAKPCKVVKLMVNYPLPRYITIISNITHTHTFIHSQGAINLMK